MDKQDSKKQAAKTPGRLAVLAVIVGISTFTGTCYGAFVLAGLPMSSKTENARSNTSVIPDNGQVLLQLAGPQCRMSGEGSVGPADENRLYLGTIDTTALDCREVGEVEHPCLYSGVNYHVADLKFRPMDTTFGSSCSAMEYEGNFSAKENQCAGTVSCKTASLDFEGNVIPDSVGSCEFTYTQGPDGQPTGDDAPTAYGMMSMAIEGGTSACEAGEKFSFNNKGVMKGEV